MKYGNWPVGIMQARQRGGREVGHSAALPLAERQATKNLLQHRIREITDGVAARHSIEV